MGKNVVLTSDNINEIIRLYKTKEISDTSILCAKYHIGKIRLMKIFSDNGIEINSRGNGLTENVKILNNWLGKYTDNDEYTYKAIHKETKEEFNDYMNKSGTLTSYLLSLNNNIEIPTNTFQRKKYYLNNNGEYWFEQYFDIIKTKKEIHITKKCKFCEWETIDIENKSGGYKNHLIKTHNINIKTYLKNYPDDNLYFNKQYELLKFENNEDEYVKCLICNKKMRRIDHKHLTSHNINIDTYIKKYSSNTVSKNLHNKLSIIAIETNKNMLYNFSSKGEKEIKQFLEFNNINIENNRKNIIGKELDIYIPKHNIAIEYNGLYWHNELFKDKNYHLDKTKLCEQNGIQLIHIFEDEWLNKKNIVKSRLLNLLGKTPNKIFGRKCIIKEVNYNDSRDFLNTNHIQGNCISKMRCGLYYEGELVSLMTFGLGRNNVNNINNNSYELIRFCNKLNTNVIGGASKLFKYFINNNNNNEFTEVITYADKRWSNGDLYNTLNFNHSHDSKPNYFYVIKNQRCNRFGFRKDILVGEGFDKNKSETTIMLERGIYRIYDCGTKVYKYLK